ncbi:hypothetical protein [Skermanella pratensis]|uniref:hypothetical protein n=1 Tax=Skermanella pratensis TaxID=2233999 RepID=UPI001300F91F|nr:hypothetical protein [Skermanella pratensis]
MTEINAERRPRRQDGGMSNNPFILKVALALVVKVAVIVAALYLFWPAPKPSPVLPRTGWDMPAAPVPAAPVPAAPVPAG